MRTLFIILALASLASCTQGHYQYDMATVEATFNTCMTTTPISQNAVALEHKIDGCKDIAWATSKETFVK